MFNLLKLVTLLLKYSYIVKFCLFVFAVLQFTDLNFIVLFKCILVFSMKVIDIKKETLYWTRGWYTFLNYVSLILENKVHYVSVIVFN